MKLVEVYTSVQGEGPHTGRPIQFVRFGGCNMRCPGWPCDTQFAIDPKFRNEWESVTPEQVLSRLQTWPRHICITGGEPLIQPSRQMAEFVYRLPGNYKVDLFTNGSQALPPWALSDGVTVIMDWKLKGSGEEPDEGMRKANLRNLRHTDGVKFVIKNHWDLEEAFTWSKQFEIWGITAQVWAGACWDEMHPAYIVEFMQDNQLNWRLNVQMHNYIWKAQERRR